MVSFKMEPAIQATGHFHKNGQISPVCVRQGGVSINMQHGNRAHLQKPSCAGPR